jgi:hypothetical protein
VSRRDLAAILAAHGLRPVLVQVGASGEPPAIWADIAPESVYVGFDPDLREIRETAHGAFHSATIINEAVTADPERSHVSFYLTRSPYCSSTLRPDAVALDQYLFADLFEVERQSEAPATSLDRVVARLALPGIDWLMLDTQGTDLRIFNSLRQEIRDQVLAVDIEPGLIDAYIGEDLFVDVQRELTRQGFWLSQLRVLGAVRLRRETLSGLKLGGRTLSSAAAARAIRTSPGWCEARYLRTIESLAERGAAARAYALLWTFALVDGQAGYAADVLAAYQRAFGDDPMLQRMQRLTADVLRRARRRASFGVVRDAAGRGAHILRAIARTAFQR